MNLIPTQARVSACRQPVKRHEELADFYAANFQQLRDCQIQSVAGNPEASEGRRARRS